MSYKYKVGDQVELFKDGEWIPGVVERVSVEYSCFYVRYVFDNNTDSRSVWEVLVKDQNNIVRPVTGDNFIEPKNIKSKTFQPHNSQDRADWLQIYCAAITGKYASEGQGIASSVSAITDQFFDVYKERWNE